MEAIRYVAVCHPQMINKFFLFACIYSPLFWRKFQLNRKAEMYQ